MSGTLALTLRWGETDLAWVKENRPLVPLGLTGSLKISFWPHPLRLIFTNYVAITIETDTPIPSTPLLKKTVVTVWYASRLLNVQWPQLLQQQVLLHMGETHRGVVIDASLTCADGRCFLRAACQNPRKSVLQLFGSTYLEREQEVRGAHSPPPPPPRPSKRITTPLAQGYCDHRWGIPANVLLLTEPVVCGRAAEWTRGFLFVCLFQFQWTCQERKT